MAMKGLEALITNLTQKDWKLIDFMAQGNFNCEESSEYKECAEVLGDWQESNESDLEG